MSMGLKANADGSGAVQVGGSDAITITSGLGVLAVAPTGLGYGTGAGGTVTQLTSKATAVTLNKPTGQITMSNASLAAGASVTFQLNNNLLSATDTLIVQIAGGTTSQPDSYAIRARIAATIAVITVTNNGGTEAATIVLNFAIIKGVTS